MKIIAHAQHINSQHTNIHCIFLYNFDRVIIEAELHDVLNIKDKHLPHSSVNLQN